MSFVREASGAIPQIMGGGLISLAVLSALSMSVEGSPVLDVPGGTFWDVVASVGALGVGFGVWASRNSLAAWLSAGVLVLGVVSAGWAINVGQAGTMLSASWAAISAGAKAGAEAGANQGSAKYRPVRKLNSAENAECDEADRIAASGSGETETLPKRLDWTQTAMGQLNCSISSDGNRWKWSVK
jgi:hypothetical protein